MTTIRICEDLGECRQLWEHFSPRQCLFDLWPVRACFQEAFARRPCFVLAQQGPHLKGLLALSWVEEMGEYACFPGEVWHGKTWLEQNKLWAGRPELLASLMEHVPGPLYVRYLDPAALPAGWPQPQVDEIGYLFHPRQVGSFTAYKALFASKSRRKIEKELDRLEQAGVSFRHDHTPDVDLMFRMNLEAFGEYSYFLDPRFLDGFERLAHWLSEQGMLRITTALVGGQPAAIDIGAVWNNTYTVLAGGTDPQFPGVAKLINFHHLEYSCAMNFDQVDFLCGDFGWKERFHLTPRPLYHIRRPAADQQRPACADNRMPLYA